MRNIITLFCLTMMVAMVSLTAMPCDQERVGPSTMARFSAVMLFSSLWSAIVERWSRTAYRLDLEQGGLNLNVNLHCQDLCI